LTIVQNKGENATIQNKANNERGTSSPLSTDSSSTHNSGREILVPSALPMGQFMAKSILHEGQYLTPLARELKVQFPMIPENKMNTATKFPLYNVKSMQPNSASTDPMDVGSLKSVQALQWVDYRTLESKTQVSI